MRKKHYPISRVFLEKVFLIIVQLCMVSSAVTISTGPKKTVVARTPYIDTFTCVGCTSSNIEWIIYDQYDQKIDPKTGIVKWLPMSRDTSETGYDVYLYQDGKYAASYIRKMTILPSKDSLRIVPIIRPVLRQGKYIQLLRSIGGGPYFPSRTWNVKNLPREIDYYLNDDDEYEICWEKPTMMTLSCTISVTDGDLFCKMVTDLTPITNEPVEILTTTLRSAINRTPYSDTVIFKGAVGYPVTLSLIQAPLDMTLDFQTGAIRWLPLLSTEQSITIKVRATDGFMDDTVTYLIPVKTQNPVAIQTTKLKPGIINTMYRDTVRCTFQTGYPLYWNLSGPVGMTIDNSTGILNWNIQPEDVGVHNVKITANDGYFRDTANFVLTVGDGTIAESSQIMGCQRFCVASCPNPFNSNVLLSVEVPDKMGQNISTIELYDVTGKRVGYWSFNGSGKHSINWNLISNESTASSNMFIVKARNGSNVLQQKLIYLK